MKKYTPGIAISLTNITKEYIIHHEKPTLVEKLVKVRDEKFYALKNINFQIRKGERIGIIGKNGSGKTTLLKIIAGITTPTKGSVSTRGRVVSLIDLEAGFHPDLTGEQNIYLNGMLLGMKKGEIEDKLNAIIRFADIGNFIDAPLFTYSDGMKLRLSFAVSAYANPDILILDEGFGAGDQNFLKKSQKKMREFYLQKKTILLVSHWLELVHTNSDRVIILDKGGIVRDGTTATIIAQYKKSVEKTIHNNA